MLCDYHIHTKYSFDGDISATPDAICEAAIALGLDDIAFTDHYEVNALPEGIDMPYDATSAFEDIMRAREKFGKQINITYGIEVGQASQYPDIANKFLTEYPVEFVLASLHNLRCKPDFYYMDFSQISEEETRQMYLDYIDELKEMLLSLDKADAVGHITYPFRYVAQAGKSVDLTPYYDRLSSLFELLISKEIALEINASTHAKGYGFTMPSEELISLYRECGGKLITLGSDAHSPAHVGASLDFAAGLAKKYGFNYATVIRKGQKELIKLT